MDYVIAFVVGGVICALTQILMEKTKLLPGRIMVLLVCQVGWRGSFRSAAWFWKCVVERHERSD